LSAERKPADAKCPDCRVVSIEGTIFTQRILCPRHQKHKEMGALVQAAKSLTISAEKAKPQTHIIEEATPDTPAIAIEVMPGYQGHTDRTKPLTVEQYQNLESGRPANPCRICQIRQITHKRVKLCDTCYQQERHTKTSEALRRFREKERGSRATLFDIRDPTLPEYQTTRDVPL